ncbi:MAG: hypothetical protein WBQ56_21740 [Candidatus Sulfotelmatobacter sp.]|jgi:hypothetical protein
MPDWIEDAARRLKAEKERRKKNEECQKTIKDTLAANGASIFGTLLGAVEKDVELFVTHFPDVKERLQKPVPLGDMEFQVVRQYSPAFLLHVTWDGRTTITWRITGDKRIASGTLNMRYNESGGGLYEEDGTPVSFADASQKMLEPAIEGLTWTK